jgi:benzodiazapine receptor
MPLLDLSDSIHSVIAVRTKQRYMELKQPPLNPPAYVFGPVWTVLYAAIGYAAHRAWTTGTNSLNPETAALARQGATLFTIQLGLNLLWMPTFFVLERPIEATIDSVALLGTNMYLTYLWSKVDDVAALVMLPYLGWLSFATYLCVSYYRMPRCNYNSLHRTGWMWIFKWLEFQKCTKKGGQAAIEENYRY